MKKSIISRKRLAQGNNSAFKHDLGATAYRIARPQPMLQPGHKLNFGVSGQFAYKQLVADLPLITQPCKMLFSWNKGVIVITQLIQYLLIGGIFIFIFLFFCDVIPQWFYLSVCKVEAKRPSGANTVQSKQQRKRMYQMGNI